MVQFYDIEKRVATNVFEVVPKFNNTTRLVYVLQRYRAGASLGVIAGELGVSVERARVLLHRAEGLVSWDRAYVMREGMQEYERMNAGARMFPLVRAIQILVDNPRGLWFLRNYDELAASGAFDSVGG